MPDPLTPGDGHDVLARFKRARETRDPEMMLELFGDDPEYRVEPFSTPLTGAIEIRAHWNRIAAEQAQVDFDAERVWVSGRTVLASWHGAYTRRADARRIRVRGFSTLELDDAGLITRMRDWPAAREVGTDSRLKPDASPAPRENEDG